MAKTKVLHLTQSTGGVKTYVAHVLAYIKPEEFEFIILAPANKLFESFCSTKSIPYYCVDLERGNNLIKNLILLFRIVTIIKKEKPDIIHAHSAKGGFLGRIAAKILGIKVIYTPHAFSYLSFSGYKRLVFFVLERMIRNWTTLLLAISYSEANSAIIEVGFKKGLVKVVLNSIPINTDLPERNFTNCNHVSMIGRLTYQKNPLLFLEIANQLCNEFSDLHFSILGAGIHDDLNNEIYHYLNANNLNERISIEKWGDASRSEKFLQDTDIYVSTSLFEGLPYSLLEAMHLKIPCLVTKVAGNNDVINNNENGFACLSVNEFCDKIKLLLQDKKLRENIGKAGHYYVASHHNLKKNIQQIEKIYKGLANEF